MHSIGTRLTGLYTGQRWLAPARPTLELIARVSAVLVLYLILQSWLRQSAHLSAADYQQPLLTPGLVRNLAHYPLAVVIAIALLAWRGRALAQGWAQLEYGRTLRWIVAVGVGLSAWAFSTYDFNFYFNQSHAVDRALLVVLALLVIWRPVFVFPYLWLLLAIVWQFDYPLSGAYPWTHANFILRALALFGGAYLVAALTGFQTGREFLFLLLCLIASFYWGSGVGKFQLNWITHPYLHYLILGAYANGWLRVFAPATAVAFSQLAANFTLPLMAFTLFVEWGAILIVQFRRLTLVLLLGAIAFHLGVFAYSGMLFWMWIVFEAVLVALMLNSKHRAAFSFFTPAYRLLSLVVIAGSGVVFRPTNLSWYDMPVSYIYQFRGLSESGQTFLLPPPAFGPYNDTFVLDNFEYLAGRPAFTHLWNVTQDRMAAEQMLRVTSAEQVFAVEAHSAWLAPDPARSLQWDDFMRRYVGNLNLSQGGAPWQLPVFLRAPRHLWTLFGDEAFAGQERLVKVQAVQVTWLYANGEFGPIRERVLREIEIAEP